MHQALRVQTDEEAELRREMSLEEDRAAAFRVRLKNNK
jgi:hypothetical protein